MAVSEIVPEQSSLSPEARRAKGGGRKRMKTLFLVVLLVSLLALPAFAAELLVNGGFEQSGNYGSSNLGPGWSHIDTQYTERPTHPLITVASPNQYWPVSHSGQKAIAMVSTADGVECTGTIVQTIQLPNGTYNVSFSGWGWVYNSNYPANVSWLRADLYVDSTDYVVGNPGWVKAFGLDSNFNNNAGWKYCWNEWTGTIHSSISLVITQRVNGYAPTGSGAVISDDWSLQANPVPEPSGLLALCGGITGLLAFRRQRR